MEKKALIISVGTGTRPDVDIKKPIIKSIRHSHPDFTGFVVSRTSEPVARSIIDQLALSSDSYDILTLSNEEDVNLIYQDTLKFIGTLMEKGFLPENIEVDFTSGTKAMSVGVVLAGFHFRCNRLNYVSGKRKNGIVISGTEKIISIPTAEILASEELKLALNMIEHLRFDSALQVLECIHPEILSEKDRALHKNLQKIAGAYKYWDLFHHNRFLELYNKVDFDKLTDQFRLPSGSLEIINVINKNVKDKALKKVKDKRIFEYIIVDLFCNAWRRFYEGKYDDAVARLYRTIELLAQTQLQIKYHIITNDVDINRLPPAFSDKLNHNKDPKDRKIKYFLAGGIRKGEFVEMVENKGVMGGLGDMENEKSGLEMCRK